jgi:hypothetical protein
MATAKKAVSRKPDEVAELRARVAKQLGVSEKQAELRALRELAESLGAEPRQEPARSPAAPSASYLPQRLYLILDGRGMPVEVIDLPCTVGSERKCTVWVNSPRIETQHLQITHSREGWVLEDLGTEHGTFLDDRKIKRRVIADGDEYRLAGYLRLRTELR